MRDEFFFADLLDFDCSFGWAVAHADFTADAALIVDQDDAVIALKGCTHRANVHTCRCIAMKAGFWHPVR